MPMLALLLIGLAACTTTKQVRELTVYKTDTLYITEYRLEVRDTTVIVPADSSLITALFMCDSLGNVLLKEITTLQGQRLRQNMKLSNNTLVVEAFADSVLVTLKYRLIYERKLQQAIADLNTSTRAEVKKPPPLWLKFLAWSGALAWTALIVWALLKGYLKWISKLFKNIKLWLN